ncbi:hypothetical protein ACMAUO_16280 [Gluconacetobacter sp. Hr-1-5]|uniref:hypothetical protein n=1 Tax=Gluconacetobacter sp. Hr-1-5 TaxID=3395370 RepID=UPI003B5155B0
MTMLHLHVVVLIVSGPSAFAGPAVSVTPPKRHGTVGLSQNCDKSGPGQTRTGPENHGAMQKIPDGAFPPGSIDTD